MNATPLRLESKYLLSLNEYWRLRAALPVHFKLDAHSAGARSGRYLVRSLYFDSHDYQAYSEKVTGEYRRQKLRLRVYGGAYSEIDFVNVEIKRRVGVWIGKDVERISPQQFQACLASRSWDQSESPVLQDFAYHIRQFDLAPKVLVEYQREAWYARSARSVRLSFDHRSRYVQTNRLFPERPFFQSDQSGLIVFEIKTSHDDLDLTNRLVHDFALKAVPNSKYANAIDHTQSAIWR
jgi:hypothetical protein